VALERGDGTNHFSETAHWIRIEDQRLNVLLTLPLYVSDINPESTPMQFQEFKLDVLEVSQTRIVVKAEMAYGIIFEPEGDVEPDEEDSIEITNHAEDIAVFVFDRSKKRFFWHSSSNPLFIPFWRDDVMYHGILKPE